MGHYDLGSTSITILATLVLLTTCSPVLGLYIGRRHLHIVNWLENHEKVKLECWSSDHHSLGSHIIDYKTEFRWKFFQMPFWNKKYECNIEFNDQGKPKRGHFVVYDSGRKIRRRDCYKHCVWGVGVHGLYAYDERDGKWDYEIPWSSRNSFD